MNSIQDEKIVFNAAFDEQLPDLCVYTDKEWADGIIISTSKGGSTSVSFTTDDTLYISFAIANYGNVSAGSFAGMLSIDDTETYALVSSGLSQKTSTIARDVYIGNLTAGRHIITIICDYYDSVAESNERNNDYSVIIKVAQGGTTPADFLLNTRWNQNGNGKSQYEYNKFVPDAKKTGCANTAMAQILYYWVEQGYGLQLQVAPEDCMYRISAGRTEAINAANLKERCGISLDDLNGIIETITCDAPNWDNDDDIAGLTLASMLILKSEIGDDATATNMYAEEALLERADFHYVSMKCSKDSVPWERIQANIDDDCPVIAGLKSIKHTVVIDGFNSETNEYHLNFGWGFEGYKNDKKYNFYTGTGWYSQDEMDVLDIMFVALDIYPNYDIDDPTKKAVATVDWTDKITPEMHTDDGFYVTIATPSQMLSLTVPQTGVNVFTSTRNATLTSECMDGTPVVNNQKLQAAFAQNDDPLLLQGKDNGLTDVFFARATGTWDYEFIALHAGDNNGWNGTGEIASLFGKNIITDIFEGTGDTAILRLTDDACGDALFADDIFSASYDKLAERQSRIDNLHEIIAGAGDDIIDMTSGRFDVYAPSIVIHGNEGDDIIWGGSGQNTLFGDAGNDRLVGGPDNDVIVGGIGDDSMAGEGGDDIFCFCENWGNDTISQIADGKVTLWFASENNGYLDPSTLTYSFDNNSVCVSGIPYDSISIKYGDDGSALYNTLKASGAFSNGMLA